jgi:histidinol-phosphate aminotransferase
MEIIDLSKNENPLGCSPLALQLASAALQRLHLYPCHEMFTDIVAQHHNVDPDHIFVASGASEIIDIIARTKLSAGTNAVTSKGSFAAYTTITHNVGATIRTPTTPDHTTGLQEISSVIDRQTRVVWLANPNNPTGTLLPKEDIELFARQHPQITVVCDEAYIDYVQNSEATSMLGGSIPNNVILLRSFSKLHGIAGTRIGYAVTHPDTANLLKKLQLPFSVSSVAIAAATGALQDTGFQELSRNTAAHARGLIATTLTRHGVSQLPSSCNFVTFTHPKAQQLQHKLLQSGFVVRELTAFGMPGFLRVSTGTIEQTQKFTQTLEQLLTNPER